MLLIVMLVLVLRKPLMGRIGSGISLGLVVFLVFLGSGPGEGCTRGRGEGRGRGGVRRCPVLVRSGTGRENEEGIGR
jgi:hypothetical protein